MDQPSASKPSTPKLDQHGALFFILVSLVVGALIGFFSFLAWQRYSGHEQHEQPVSQLPAATTTDGTQTAPTTSTNVTASSTDATSNTTTTLDITWKPGVIVHPAEAFGTFIAKNSYDVKNPFNDPTQPEDLGNPASIYTIAYDFFAEGSVASGAYQGWQVYGAKLTSQPNTTAMDPAQTPRFLNLIVAPDKSAVKILGAAPSQILALSWPHVEFAQTLLPNLSQLPTTLTLENGKVLTQAQVSLNVVADPLCSGGSCINRLPLGRTTDGRNLYTGDTASTWETGDTKPGCVIAYLENGQGVIYESVIPPFPADSKPTMPRLVSQNEIDWQTAYDNAASFRAHDIGGCGGVSCVRVVGNDDQFKPSDLVQAGKTRANGDPLFVYSPKALAQQPAFALDVYNNWYDYDQQNTKPSYVEFIKKVPVPVFFWKDAFDRYVVYKNNAGVPQAECGKPVIYLYPTKAEDVSVKLPSFISVTKSEPAYPASGWNVHAEPSGALTLKDTGAKVSSLYWEGVGVNYSAPTTGFIVKDGTQATFLASTLAKYGLTPSEARDFMDFWLPRMTGAPYYRVSFLTNEWNAAAPLYVSPMPQTNLRIFMDWQKLNGPITLNAPTIKTPVRTGFTLVEWGGLLH